MISRLHKFFTKKVYRNINSGELFYFGIWFILLTFLWSHMFYSDGKYYWAGHHFIWGDWSFHIPLVLNFAYRPFPLPSHPLFSGQPLQYHFAADLISGFLMKIGVPLAQSLILPSIILSIILVIFVYYLYKTIFNSRLTSFISSLIFLFNGGLGIFIFLNNHFIQKIPIDNPPPLFMLTKMESIDVMWINFWLAEFVPQRPFLLGAPVVILTIMLFWKIQNKGIQKIPDYVLLITGIIDGFLPIIHYQSFYVVLLLAIFSFMITKKNSRKIYLKWLLFFVPYLVIFIIISLIFFKNVPHESLHLKSEWMETGAVLKGLVFWIKNIGVMVFLIPMGFIKSNKKTKLFYLPFLFLYIISNLFIFSTNDENNRKFLLYWYLISSGLVGNLLSELLKAKQKILFISASLFLYLSTISGLIDYANLYNFKFQKYRMFSENDMTLAQTVRDKTNTNDVFLTAPTNTWMGMILGRQIIMTYDNWLNSHGFNNTRERINDTDAIYSNPSQQEKLLNKYHIDFVIFGPSEKSRYRRNAFRDNFPVLAQNENTIVYDVREMNK